jgi:protein-tyrosine phosphatase
MTENKLQIAMVCHGNICRSPMAEAVTFTLLEKYGLTNKVSVESFGTHAYHVGEDADKRSKAALSRHGWPVFVHRARQLKTEDLERLNIILCADRNNLSHVKYMSRKLSFPPKEISLLRSYDPDASEGADVPDPYYDGQAVFDAVLEIIESACQYFVQSLTDIFRLA